MSYQNIITKVAEELGLPESLVNETYKSFWRYVRETIKELPLKEDLSQEEFDKLQTNFNIPSIGKLSCTWNRYNGVKKQFEKFKELKNVHN
jgi:hypothetical protein